MRKRQRNPRNSHTYERGGISFTHEHGTVVYRVRFPADPWGLGWGDGHTSVTKVFRKLSPAVAWYHREINAQDRAQASGTRWLTERQRIRDRAAARLTFRDYARRYLAGYRTGNGYGRRPAASTMSNKRNSVRHLVEILGDRQLRAITPADIVRTMTAVQKHGASQAHADGVELKTMLKRAAMRDEQGHALIAYNPAANVPAPTMPRSRQAQKPAITPREERQLYAWFQQHDPADAVLIPLACNVDLRPQDYLALKVGDIDPANLTLNVRRSQTREKGKGLTTKAPKTAASASIRRVPRQLMTIIEKHIAAHTDGRPTSWLISGPQGGMLSRNTWRNRFHRAAIAIGRPDLSPYVMRATADDRIARHATGMNAKELLAMQGRSDEATSIRHYQKLDAATMQAHAQAIWDATHSQDDGNESERSQTFEENQSREAKPAHETRSERRADLESQIDRLTRKLEKLNRGRKFHGQHHSDNRDVNFSKLVQQPLIV